MNDYVFESKNGLVHIQANTLKEAKKIAHKNKNIIADAYVIKVKRINN
jgi:hypothetical protein